MSGAYWEQPSYLQNLQANASVSQSDSGSSSGSPLGTSLTIVQRGPSGEVTDYSQVVGTTAVERYPDLSTLSETPSYIRIMNVSAAGGPNLWVSRKLGNAVAPHTAGAVMIPPGEYEVWTAPGFIPLNPVWAIADNTNCNTTVEVG